MQQSLVETSETKNKQSPSISHRMQHQSNEEFLLQRDHGKSFH